MTHECKNVCRFCSATISTYLHSEFIAKPKHILDMNLERNYESTKNFELDQACFQQQTTIIESIETFQYMKEITHEIYIEYNYAYVICKVLFG